jgi:hypothetical protein
MDRSNRVRQLYGYAVCLIAVVTMLIATTRLVGSAINLSDPTSAASAMYGSDISSFEAWMVSRDRFSSPAKTDTVSTETLRTRYEAARASQLAQQRFRDRKELIIQLILLTIAVTLFVTHWRWLRGARNDDLGAVV